eukprot:COSAG02_NODE_13619_length_1371_cov_2.121069_1_plen_152_part_10
MCLYLSCRPVLIRLSSARGFRTSGDPEVTDKGINGICIQAGGNSSTGYDCPGWIKATWQGANPGGVGGGKWGTPYQWRSAGAPPVKEDYIHSPSRTPGNGSGFPFTTDFPTWQLGSGLPTTLHPPHRSCQPPSHASTPTPSVSNATDPPVRS